MNSLIELSILPALIALLGLVPTSRPWLPKAAAILCLAQLPVAVFVCLPASRGAHEGIAPFGMDGIGVAFTCITALVSAASMVQAGFLNPAEQKSHPVSDRQFRLFYTLSGLFMVSMYAVPLAQNLGYMWIALEATTLMSAPLVDFHRTKSSLEATWKYLLLCSVGIAFAFFGTLLILAAQGASAGGGTLSLAKLSGSISLNPLLTRVGFVFCLLGYGTKAGLFPLHSWLPDAHSEAPAPISAMLSGALLNCAVVAIWRVSRVMAASGQMAFVAGLLVPAGTITVVAAGIMLVRQHDLKRMWAYSSVEHIGLLIVAVGMGAGPILILQAFNHSIAKCALFLMSGNVLEAFGTKALTKLGGLLRTAPLWGIGLAAAGLAIAGSPPFGTFLSEWLLIKGVAVSGHGWAVAGLIAGLTLTFMAIASHLNPLIFGEARPAVRAKAPAVWSVVPVALVVLSLCAGLAVTPAAISFLGSLSGVGTP